MDKIKNFGYFIVPFSIEKSQQKAFGEYIKDLENSGKIKLNKEMFKCSYIFSHVINVFLSDQKDSFVKTYDMDLSIIDETRLVDSVFSKEKNYVASIVELRIIQFSEYMGFLLLKIDYQNMSPQEIASFVFATKRTKRQDYSTTPKSYRDNSIKPIIEKLLPEDKCTPFFYCADKDVCFCDVFQLVGIDENTYRYDVGGIEDESKRPKYDDYYHKLISSLGRGYDPRLEFNVEELKQNKTDMKFSPFPYYDWCGSPSVLSCLINYEKTTFRDVRFLNDEYQARFQNDYLMEYLILLNQKYSTMYLLKCITDDKYNINTVEKMLVDFRVKYSFVSISNEMTYQNLYNKMTTVLDIKGLTEDVNDSSEKIMSISRKEAEKRNDATNGFLFALGLLVIGSALIDFSDYFDKWNSFFHTGVNSWASLAVVVVIVAIAIAVYIIRRNKKNGD